jgi:hypothetical protein
MQCAHAALSVDLKAVVLHVPVILDLKPIHQRTRTADSSPDLVYLVCDCGSIIRGRGEVGVLLFGVRDRGEVASGEQSCGGAAAQQQSA